MDEINMSISIPSDEDGFILLKCPLCKEFFKVTVEDLNLDEFSQIWCPYCGIQSEDYFTDDVMELIEWKLKNETEEQLFKEFKKLEHSSNSAVEFTVKKSSPTKEPILDAGVDNLVINKYQCCNKYAKITQTAQINGGYCPFCGVMTNGN